MPDADRAVLLKRGEFTDEVVFNDKLTPDDLERFRGFNKLVLPLIPGACATEFTVHGADERVD